MSVDAIQIIRDSLQTEARSRRQRAFLALLLLLGLSAAFPIATGFRPLSPPTYALLGVAMMLLFWIIALMGASRPLVRSPWLLGVAGLATALPMLSSERWLDPDVPFVEKAIGCFLSIAILGSTSLLAIRLVFGEVRRRFGKARVLQGAAAAVVGVLGVGLHCPLDGAFHAVSHVLAAAVVSLLIARILLPE